MAWCTLTVVLVLLTTHVAGFSCNHSDLRDHTLHLGNKMIQIFDNNTLTSCTNLSDANKSSISSISFVCDSDLCDLGKPHLTNCPLFPNFSPNACCTVTGSVTATAGQVSNAAPSKTSHRMHSAQ